MIPKKYECPTCDGEGELECNLGHIHECEDCDGEGEIEEAGGKMVRDPDEVFVIDGIALRCELLERVITVAKALELETVYKVAGKVRNPALFIIGDVRVLLAACRETSVTNHVYILVDLPEII